MVEDAVVCTVGLVTTIGVTNGNNDMELYALVSTLIKDWVEMYGEMPTSFDIQLLLRGELSRTNEDGTLMYPHMQDKKPPIPSRFVQTREAKAKATSETYNGDSKVYAALRSAVYVCGEIIVGRAIYRC